MNFDLTVGEWMAFLGGFMIGIVVGISFWFGVKGRK